MTVTQERFKNAWATTLSSAMGTTDTTLPLASASGLSTGGQMRFLLGPSAAGEKVIATLDGSTAPACTRGAEGTTPATHTAGEAVTAILTAGGLNSFGDYLLGNSQQILASGVSLNLASTAQQAVFTVPASLPGGAAVTRCIVQGVVLRDASAAVEAGVKLGFGFNAPTFDNWSAPSSAYSALSSTALFKAVSPDSVAALGTTGATFAAVVTVKQSSACTVRVDALGYLV